jgi:hypothetical protein
VIKRENIQNIRKLLISLAQKQGKDDKLTQNVIDDLNLYLNQDNKQDLLSVNPEKLGLEAKSNRAPSWAEKLKNKN